MGVVCALCVAVVGGVVACRFAAVRRVIASAATAADDAAAAAAATAVVVLVDVDVQVLAFADAFRQQVVPALRQLKHTQVQRKLYREPCNARTKCGDSN